jgi:hypothetical protein
VYSKKIPFKDFKGNPHNELVRFNLTVREIPKLLNEFNLIFKWQESLKGDERELTTDEVIEFYTAFEAVLLTAWGEMSDDGLHFRKTGRYDFEDSALFAACMVEFVSNPGETGKLLEAIMPEGMEELVRKAEGNLDKMAADPDTTADLRAEIERLRAQLPAAIEPAGS